MQQAQSHHGLAPGTVLNGVYTVEAELGQGGFGIVYRALHCDLGLVAIKEYLPVELAVREGRSVQPRSTDSRGLFEEGLGRFQKEAKQLIRFRTHQSIVSCRDFFRANGTAYLVMDFEEGLSLSKLLEVREAQGKPFEEADLLAVIVPLLEGLAQVHKAGVLHRDIKPSNILIRREDERPVLIDFGAAKQEFAKYSKSLAPYSPGYAAIEQMSEGRLGTWTDLYGVGAVMWRMAAGGNRPYNPPQPVKAERRLHAKFRGEPDPMPSARKLGRGRFSERVLRAIDRCLKLGEQDRVQDCGELLRLIRGEGAVESKPLPPIAPEAKSAWMHGEWWAVPLFVIVLLLLLVGLNQPENQTALQRAAEQGDAKAQFNLGLIYAEGKGVSKNNAEAVRWFRQAAEQGNAEAQVKLGVAYARGIEVPKNDAEAAKWYRRAAVAGNAEAQFNLGSMYAKGDGVPEDDAEAVRWFRQAAEQGDVRAQSALGEMYVAGEGVPVDDAEALRWFRRAGEQGDANTQTMLGIMYYAGVGAPQDTAEAFKWYRQAAEQGIAFAQLQVGAMYGQGVGVPENDAEAIRWYRLAAEQGEAKAQYNLGKIYEQGGGVPKDYVAAHMFYNIAATKDYKDYDVNNPNLFLTSTERENLTARGNRDRLAKKMTAAQISEAQRRAQAWQDKRRPGGK